MLNSSGTVHEVREQFKNTRTKFRWGIVIFHEVASEKEQVI